MDDLERYTFNSLSRDHLANRTIVYLTRHHGFQFPLSGSLTDYNN